MKITSIETHIANIGTRNVVFLRTLTDTDIYGVGEAYTVGPDLATKEWVDYFAAQIIGSDPTDIERLWSKMHQGSRFPIGSSGLAAISGIDLTLWDILGKSAGAPVYKLAGGAVRDRIPLYMDIVWDRPDAAQKDAVAAVLAAGYTAIKTQPLPSDWREIHWAEALEAARSQTAELRRRTGPSVEIGLDAHAQQLEPWRALELADALAEFNLLFIEEPLRMENRSAMADLRRQYPVPLATGECLYTKFEFDELIRLQAADIIQPDVAICGGFTEMRKIATNAEAHDISVAPHNPSGPLATVVDAHFAAATSNFLILEIRPHSGEELAMVPGSLAPDDGFLPLPEGPGWGVDLDFDVIAGHPYESGWWRSDVAYPDGSIAYI
jgi:galactonate dehydratase